jgi:hypothetical protein
MEQTLSSIQNFSTELLQAISEGFNEELLFVDGMLISPTTGHSYSYAWCEKEPRPCCITQTTVYRITSPDGKKWVYIYDWRDQEHD